MTAFKIGSVYRDRDGDLIRLTRSHGVYALAEYFDQQEQAWLEHGACFNGKGECLWMHDYAPAGLIYGLLPEELHQVDGSWVPVARGVEEKEEGMTADELLADLLRELDANMPMDSRDSMGVPALTWADTKPVDRWEGFTVYSETTEHPSHSHPTQKMQEGRNPAFGSAALLKVR